MYKTRDDIEQLTELGENKQNIIVLLEKLADLGWERSHWVKYMDSDEQPFIEIYGDNSYKHIKGDTIEQCYELALESVKKLKECVHTFNYRDDAFKICVKCGQFGHATVEEMKLRFDKFHVKDQNKNDHYYSNEPLCEECGYTEMIRFSHSRKDAIGNMCPNCKTVVEKRLKSEEYGRFGLQAEPTEEEFKLKIPYKEENMSLSIHKMVSFGRETEQSLTQKINQAYVRLLESVEATEKVINPDYVLTNEEASEYLTYYVMSNKFVLQKEEEQYNVRNIDFVFSDNKIEKTQLTLEKINESEHRPSDEEIFKDVLDGLLENISRSE